MTSPDIQKDIVNSCAKERVKAIIEDLNGDYFGILVDESKEFLIRNKCPLFCAVAKKHHDVNNFFDILYNVLNNVGGSFKRREMLQGDEAEKLEELLMLGEVHTGSGLNQELGLQRPGDTRWRSHFKTVHNFISLFSSIVYVLEVLENEGVNYHEKAMAKSLVGDIKSYEFIYILHLMLKILEITYDLNMALQRKDKDIVTAMKLVDLAKKQLQSMRESKWNSLVEDIYLFCEKNDIMIPKMDEKYGLGKSKRKSSSVTYSHHLCVEVFYAVIDLQLLELNNSFNAVNIDLLLGMASLRPDNSFINYDKKIMKLATYYLNEFDASKIKEISFDLDTYIYYVSKEDNAFSNLKGLGDLSMALVKTNMHKTQGLVYLL
ncbi:uncharacterized protein LOC125817296 [Solanum verrucosum]|uniref:uncharacterized protein LOC125817296 n=1 Tax=Solanum verrucosum TaxID=315347 RepID=UPI0020D1EE83|nr:uncharacterized protein LOC125817296 [Solanum verrucosum]